MNRNFSTKKSGLDFTTKSQLKWLHDQVKDSSLSDEDVVKLLEDKFGLKKREALELMDLYIKNFDAISSINANFSKKSSITKRSYKAFKYDEHTYYTKKPGSSHCGLIEKLKHNFHRIYNTFNTAEELSTVKFGYVSENVDMFYYYDDKFNEITEEIVAPVELK